MKSLELTSTQAEHEVPGLIALCRDPTVPMQTRAQAAQLLGRIGAPAEAAIPVLIELLAPPFSPEAEPTARWAAKGLALFGERAAPATGELAELAADDTRTVQERLVATEALGRIGGADPQAIPALMQLAAKSSSGSDDDEHDLLRAAAIDSLAFAGPTSAGAVPLLIRLTRDPHADIRQRAANALGAIGTASAVATEALVDLLLFDEQTLVRDAAASALAQIGEAGEAALVHLLSDQDVTVRRFAAAALVDASPFSTAGRRDLVAALEDEDADVRLSAVEALLAADHDREKLLAVLLSALELPKRQPRIRAYRLLTQLPEVPPSLKAQVEDLAEDERSHVRQVAQKLLAEWDERTGGDTRLVP